MDFIAKTSCVAVMAAAVAPTLLDLRVDLILPRMMALLRLTQGFCVIFGCYSGFCNILMI